MERYAYEMALELSREHEVTVLCATREAPKEENLEGIKVIRQKPAFIISNTPVKISLPFELLTMIKRRRFDLIISHTPVPFYADVASLVARLMKLPLTIYYHAGSLEKGSWVDFLAKLYSLTVERFTLRNTELVGVSHHVANILKKKGFRAKVRYPRIAKGFINTKPNYRGNYVLFVGQLTKAHRWKNLELLIKAFVRARDAVPTARLVIVGTGDFLEYYRSLAGKLGVGEAVSFTGFVSDEELVELYRNAKLFVLPSSESEAFGKVVVEAMILGTPVIVSNVGEFPVIVENGKAGIIIEPSPENIAGAIKELLENEKLRRKMAVFAARRARLLTSVSSWRDPQG
nr:glycosyltransferase family 4 protein [Thermococcus sp. MV11]